MTDETGAASADTEHHLVSRALLRRFCDSTNEMLIYRKQYRALQKRGPGAVGWVTGLNVENPTAFEERWQAVENLLPEVFVAVDDRTIFQSDALTNVLRRCIALHMARSHILVLMHSVLLPMVIERQAEQIRRDPKLIDLFREAHGGLYPAGSEGLSSTADDAIERLTFRLQNSDFLAERMIDNYEKALEFVGHYQLEIAVISEGDEFVIGDIPATARKNGHPGVGPLGGVPWNEADALFMPIGRKTTVSLAQSCRYVDAPPELVRFLNVTQIASAREHVMWHPEADLRGYVNEILDQLEAS